MKISNVLLRQHIGWHFSKLWNVQGKRKIIDCGVEKTLREKNIDICNSEEIVRETLQQDRVKIVGCENSDKEVHKEQYETVLSYKDNNVLLEGLKQAKVITNSVEIKQGLPEHITEKYIKKDHTRIERMILEALILDAEQKKLPKVKDPERPSWNFPRSFAVTKGKVSKNFISKILQHVDMDSNKNVLERNYILQDLYFKLPLQKYGSIIQFELRIESAIFSHKSIPPVTTESTANIALPDLFPIKPIVSLNSEKVEKTKTVYPYKSNSLKLYPHTIFVFYNPEEVKNEFEKEVSEDQICGRSLLKAFTVAGSFAKQEYGENCSKLPNPVTVQCIQTDGKFFHFGILQLNDFNNNENSEKNIWYQTPLMALYENCSYISGQPVLKHYNPNVINYLYNLCNNK